MKIGAVLPHLGMLTALRREGWRRYPSALPSPARWPQNPPVPWPDTVLAAA